MTEFNPNCGRCGMLNSRGFCSLTACRYPSNAIVVEPKVIRGMMVNPQIEKPQTNADRIRSMTDEELAEWIDDVSKSWYDEGYTKDDESPLMSGFPATANEWIVWFKAPADKESE